MKSMPPVFKFDHAKSGFTDERRLAGSDWQSKSCKPALVADSMEQASRDRRQEAMRWRTEGLGIRRRSRSGRPVCGLVLRGDGDGKMSHLEICAGHCSIARIIREGGK